MGLLHRFRNVVLPAAVLLLVSCGVRDQVPQPPPQAHGSCEQLVAGWQPVLGRADLNPLRIASPEASAAAPAVTRSWSDPAGWPDGRLPGPGEDVFIPRGEVVLFDVAEAELSSLRIDGSLVFAPTDDARHLTAGHIEVRGSLHVGSPAEPFAGRAVITLGAAEGSAASPCFGRNWLGLVHGRVEMYGADSGGGAPAWTQLAETARDGARTITVADGRGFRKGDSIAISNTDYYRPDWSDDGAERMIEVRTVTAVAAGGTILTLDAPLEYRHDGESRPYGAKVLEARASVMRLNRNVTVQGPEGSDRDGAGGQIVAIGDSRLRLDSVELTRMGIRGELMRYPVHFHLMGDAASGSFVRNSSLHHLYNRCVTIHGSAGVLLDGNAAFDTYGHCYFLEDGAEIGNVLRGNLGMLTRKPPTGENLLPTDADHLGPTVFWVTNPANTLIGNVASSSRGSGFWYSLPVRPTGPSAELFADSNLHPRSTPLGEFRGNTAHSNYSDGLHVDRGPNADTLAAETASYRPRSGPGDGLPEPAFFRDFTAYRHDQDGAWFRGDSTWLEGALLVDNAVGVTFASNDSGLTDSVVVGFSGEGRRPRNYRGEDFNIRGFQFYDGDVHVRNTHFAGFTEQRDSALSFNDFTGFAMSPRSSASGLSFAPGTRRVNLVSFTAEERAQAIRDGVGNNGFDGYTSGLFIDLDGSVTDSPGAAVTGNTPFHDVGCVYRDDWNALVCDRSHAALTLRNLVPVPGVIGPVELRRGHRGNDPAQVMFGTPTQGRAETNFRTLVTLGHEYDYTLAGPLPEALGLHLGEAEAGTWVIVSLPWNGGRPYVYPDWWLDTRGVATASPSLDALRRQEETGWYLDGDRLHVRLHVPHNRNDRDWEYVYVCRRELCGR